MQLFKVEYDELHPEGRCPHLCYDSEQITICGIYSTRPNACKAFPFSLRKREDGRYRLVIHAKCSGFGKGKVINIRKKIRDCVRHSNREFKKRRRIDFEGFDNNKSILIKNL